MRTVIVKKAFAWHKALLWPGFIALFLFIISGFMHIVMTWFGPQTAIVKPPSQQFESQHVQQIPSVLSRHHIKQANTVKLVPSADGVLLQVSEENKPRRYFNLHTHDEMLAYDEKQARWLAQYYVNDNSRLIESVSYQTQFDDDYPWVNRFLPVYKVVFAGDEKLTVYIHTESMMMSMMSNQLKQNVQWVFRQFHTGQFLETVPYARVMLMMVMLSSILAIIFAGVFLLFLVRRQSQVKHKRFWHRLIAYVVMLPLFGFTASGIYHLLYSEFVLVPRDFNVAETLDLTQRNWITANDLLLDSQPLQTITLLSIDGKLWYRASVAGHEPVMHGPHAGHDIREQRFKGQAKEIGGLYFPAEKNITQQSLNDSDVARYLASQLSGVHQQSISSTNVVTHFGPDYDFRNKRLPVWKVQLSAESGKTLFIDVSSGLLVDSVDSAAALEGLSFSVLHKWNFLSFLVGREVRDALIVFILTLVLVLGFLGWRIRR